VLVDLVLLALAMAVYPVALTIFILLLASSNGPRKGAAFVFGWLVTLAVVATATILATGNKPPATGTKPSIGILAAKIALGLVLVVIAERQRRRIGKPKPPKAEPRWQARIDDMSPLFAVGLGALFQPTVFVISAVATITEAKLSSAGNYLALVVFGLLSVSTYLALDVYAVARPERSDEVLARLKSWIDRHSELIVVLVAGLVGLWLIGKSSYLLAT
jgi:Sap, sulfolipid-1-addressing protein